MKRFKVGQVVEVLKENCCLAPPPPSKEQRLLAGQTGVVVRVLSDGRAWVKMKSAMPDEIRVFDLADSMGRAQWVALNPEWCRFPRTK
mgnify:CR=1 FL=1